jgi:multidrug efflux pump subunit AcrA (membrane-fusion protein)
MKKRSKIIIGMVAVAAVIAAAAVWYAGGDQDLYETEAIERGAVVQEVTVTGSLQPAERVSLEPETSGRVTEKAVSEGDLVKAGDVLVRLDDRDLQARLQSQRASLAAARAALSELVAGPTGEDLAISESAVRTAEAQLAAARQAKEEAALALENARRNLVTVQAKADVNLSSKTSAFLSHFDAALTKATDAMVRLDGPLYTEDGQIAYYTRSFEAETEALGTLALADAALERLGTLVASVRSAATMDMALASYAGARAELAVVIDHLDASVQLMHYAIDLPESTVVTNLQNLSLAQTNLRQADDQLISAKTAIDVQERMNDAEVSTAEAQVTGAEGNLRSAEAAAVTAESGVRQAESSFALKRSGARPEAIAAQRARVLVEEAALAGLATDLTKRRLVAPIDGVVTDIAVDVGETVAPGRAVVSLNAQGNFEIVSNVSEVDIAKVAVGQSVHITLDAFSRSEEWVGHVTKIHPAEKVVEGVIFYEIRVMFDEDDARLKSGMTANLAVETAKRDDALRLPLRALRQVGGVDYVDVLVDGAAVETEVKLGVENSTHAEVIAGLAEGDLVIVGKKD